MSEAHRFERDTFGEIAVPSARLWGAQTQRSLQNFKISTEKQSPELIRSLALIKRAAAEVNLALGVLPAQKAKAIVEAAQEVIDGKHPGEFPLAVWQTGSGTQTNMNLNEVIANRASELLGGERGEARLVHPNDDVNRGQSSNDVFPTAMHVAAAEGITRHLVPALTTLRDTLAKKSREFADIVKIGRTHLQDATPLTLGQEFSGYVAQLDQGIRHVQATLPHLYELALGGTAVGTGLNAHPEFAVKVANEIGRPRRIAVRDRPQQIRSHGGGGCARVRAWRAEDRRGEPDEDRQRRALARERPALRVRRTVDPRERAGQLDHAGQGESDPVRGGDDAVLPGVRQRCGGQLRRARAAISSSMCSGPLIAHNVLQSIRLLTDGAQSFNDHCASGIEANRPRIHSLLNESLMLVTALNPHIGYDKAAKIAKKAHKDGSTLKAAALELGFVTESQFDEWVKPEEMVGKRN